MGSVMRRIDELTDTLKIIQDTDGFCFGTDAILLAKFAAVKNGERVVDLCSGNGIIPILLTDRYKPSEITAVELQKSVAALCRENMELNGLNVNVVCDDLKNASKYISKPVDVVTCNPPYTPWGGGEVNDSETKIIARHEIFCTVKDIFESVSKILKFGGRFYMIHRADRLADIIYTARSFRLEPKTLRFVHADSGKNASLLLISFIHGGGSQMTIMPPINDSGNPI